MSFSLKIVLSAQFSFVVAITAVDWSVFTRLERHFGLLAALSAYYGEHLSWSSRAISTSTIALCFPCTAALRTASRLVLEATGGVELLLSSGKGEILSAI